MRTKITPNAGGLGSAIVETGLHFVIETIAGFSNFHAVHVFHGSPACESWWISGNGKIRSDMTLDQAKELVDILAGRTDAWKHFDLVSRDTQAGGTTHRPLWSNEHDTTSSL